MAEHKRAKEPLPTRPPDRTRRADAHKPPRRRFDNSPRPADAASHPRTTPTFLRSSVMPRYTAEQRAEIAAEYDGYANGLERVADDIAAEGYGTAADIQRDTAASLREVADAARDSSAALKRIY